MLRQDVVQISGVAADDDGDVVVCCVIDSHKVSKEPWKLRSKAGAKLLLIFGHIHFQAALDDLVV